MAQTPEESRNQERRKMRLQAALNARRKSLMNLVAPRGVYAEEGPGTALPVYEELTPHPTVSGNVVEPPAPLPGQDIVDANHSAAINLARQNPGVNLTDELNRRAAAQTGLDRLNMGFGRVVPEFDTAVVQDLYRQNAIDAEVAAPTIPTPLPAIQPTPLDYGPGLTPAAAEERYGPGGMYGTTPLPGGLYDQTGIAPTRLGSRQTVFPSDERLQSSSTQLTDAVRKIKKRAAIIRGTAALVGGDQKAADRYEAKALANLGIYAGQYAMSQLTDADFQDKQTLFQSLLAKGMPLDQILQVLESGVADALDPTKLKDQQKQVFVDSEGNEHAGKLAWDADGNLKYLKRNGEPAPDDWIPRAAQGTTLEANLNMNQGQPMSKAAQVNLARASLRNILNVKEYFFNDDGTLKAGLIDTLLARAGVPGTEGQKAKAQMQNALGDALRLETGAAITQEEVDNMMARYFPQVGDSDETISYKLNEFERRMRDAIALNNPEWAAKNLPAPRWNPAQVTSSEEVEALIPGSYFQTPSMQKQGKIARKPIKDNY